MDLIEKLQKYRLEKRITQQELASKLFVSREAVNKCLHDFKARGWVQVGRATISIQRLQALSDVGQRD